MIFAVVENVKHDKKHWFSRILACAAAVIAMLVAAGKSPWVLIGMYWLGVAGYWIVKGETEDGKG